MPKKNWENVDKAQYEDYENMKFKNSTELHSLRNIFNNTNSKVLKAFYFLLGKFSRPDDANIKIE